MAKRKSKTNINSMSTAELQQELKNATGTRRNSIVKLLEQRGGKH